MIALTSMGIGVGALIYLLKLPDVTSCDSAVQNDAGELIYCATTMVDVQDAQKLVTAINLANRIPRDNPLRENSDRLINQWLNALLEVSEKSFHQGDFPTVIETLEEVSENIPNYSIVREKIQFWQSVWEQGESIYEQAKNVVNLQERDTWYKGLEMAKGLKKVKNEYWSGSQYYQLVQHIQGIREQAEKIEQEEKITQQQEKEAEIARNKSRNQDLLSSDVDGLRGDSHRDSVQLEKARNLAKSGKVHDMRLAISEASLVISDTHYQDAQRLISSLEKRLESAEDKSYLENARKTAINGDIVSLQSAINEASLVRKNSPFYQQSRQQIQQWQQQVVKLNQNRSQVSVSANSSYRQRYNSNSTTTNSSNLQQGFQRSVTNPESTSIPVFSSIRDISQTTFQPYFQTSDIEKLERDLINQELASPTRN
ncbi:hypothetical protein [Calothrix sp. NIES-3974]|uniref:hypothetical protein n=1 Tax=Calothrix sp. NIES-3974 TaxID=2005462 RepID=UPI000B5F6874|nr:hypothetical protein [Calothrix sp. NIES-3974]BAZ03694.1 hypothetical protein NIES3974_03230 [Calothrix sp. NIES-3974]